MLRSVVLVWLLAGVCFGNRAEDSFKILSVSVGESVLLPCSCYGETKKLVWQIGENIVVNHCCEYKDPLHESYVNRTQVFFRNTKGNCSLLLHDVSLNDSRNFTCYIFDGEVNLREMHVVGLNVTDAAFTAANLNTPQNQPEPKPHARFAVGLPLLLLLLILTGLVVVPLVRRNMHRGPKRVLIQDPQEKPAIMTHSSV